MRMQIGNMTQERAARRFHQINLLEVQIQAKAREIVDLKAQLTERKDEYDMLVMRQRIAARDEGELPLFETLEDADA